MILRQPNAGSENQYQESGTHRNDLYNEFPLESLEPFRIANVYIRRHQLCKHADANSNNHNRNGYRSNNQCNHNLRTDGHMTGTILANLLQHPVTNGILHPAHVVHHFPKVHWHGMNHRIRNRGTNNLIRNIM